MITIPLPGNSPLSNAISYSVSPLYELAASLHTLAQPTPPERFISWSEDKLEQFESVRLKREWDYLLPLFRYGIPDSFDPVHTKGVMAVDDQYEYFVTLPTEEFVRSVSPMLDRWLEQHSIPQVLLDIREDSDYVKGRFSLFVSSYWQMVFEENWEAIAPQFVKEAERIYYAVQDIPAMLAYLHTISPAFAFDETARHLTHPSDEPNHDAQQLILYPSYYYAQEPCLRKMGSNAHLLYSFS
ncbi:hypothetical protein [Brevibacillus parabrevis]|uniref:hypothetical protein n=1 Tax=Brevibacillus parabrevis TaxID=54914 RepID=UPI002E1ADC22|nr:hypothetical protein [Brevibacillus parabrevis]